MYYLIWNLVWDMHCVNVHYIILVQDLLESGAVVFQFVLDGSHMWTITLGISILKKSMSGEKVSYV